MTLGRFQYLHVCSSNAISVFLFNISFLWLYSQFEHFLLIMNLGSESIDLALRLAMRCSDLFSAPYFNYETVK